MAITLFCPDPNGDCPSSNPTTCSNDCVVSCDCPDDYEYRFLTYPPSYNLSAADQATLDNDCGAGNYTRLTPVDGSGNPLGSVSDCYDATDPSARVECYKCNSYPGMGGGGGWPGFASVGPAGSSVFIG